MTDNNKIINSICIICNDPLPWTTKEVIMLLPCEHLVHKKCYDDIKASYCFKCKIFVKRTIRAFDYKYEKKLYQKCIDIISMSNFDKMTKVYNDQVLLNLPTLMGTIARLPFSKGINESLDICKDVLQMNDIEIKVRGLNKIKSGPKIFIANHTSHLDFLVIFYVLKTGFLASSVLTETFVGRHISQLIPLLLIDRGKKSNNVEKMKEYVKTKGPICLFPEGMITHPDTLIRFRTGAFYTGYPVYPIVLKYKNVVSDMSTPNFIMKIASKQKEVIEMIILDPFYPPFDENKIEMVRCAMAQKGNMVLSRVSNKDLRDEK